MANNGFRNPRLHILISLAVTLISWASVAWGVIEMQTLGHETAATTLAIGLAIAPGVIAPGMLMLAVKGARIVAANRRGEGVIARWTVAPEELAEFAVNNAARNALGAGYQNDWTPPDTIPRAGIEIVFGPDGVRVDDTYFGLVTTGMFKFEGVQMLPENPLSIEFGTVATSITNVNNVRVETWRGVLRLPVSRVARAEAVRALEHYKRVDAREIIVNPGFYRGRIRFGLIAAAVSFAVAAAGFTMEFSGYRSSSSNDLVPILLAVGGVIFGIGGLILALIASWLSFVQHAKRR